MRRYDLFLTQLNGDKALYLNLRKTRRRIGGSMQIKVLHSCDNKSTEKVDLTQKL